MDREARARAIVERVRGERPRTPRWLWIVALVISVVCVGALAIAWIEDRDTVAVKQLPVREVDHSPGLGLGLMLGIGVGIAIASVFAVRRRRAQ